MKPAVQISVEDMKPRPQGSKRHVGNGRMIEQSRHVGPYRDAIRLAAATQMFGRDAHTGPVSVSVSFYFKRPASHYRGKSGELRDDAPQAFAIGMQRGDLDKLLRAVLDALTGVVFADDRQVVAINANALACDRDATHINVVDLGAAL